LLGCRPFDLYISLTISAKTNAWLLSYYILDKGKELILIVQNHVKSLEMRYKYKLMLGIFEIYRKLWEDFAKYYKSLEIIDNRHKLLDNTKNKAKKNSLDFRWFLLNFFLFDNSQYFFEVSSVFNDFLVFFHCFQSFLRIFKYFRWIYRVSGKSFNKSIFV
jgi:hypothetical protein